MLLKLQTGATLTPLEYLGRQIPSFHALSFSEKHILKYRMSNYINKNCHEQAIQAYNTLLKTTLTCICKELRRKAGC